jgi:hypothetical protein
MAKQREPRKRISDQELNRRSEQPARALMEQRQLLFSRQQARPILGYPSLATLIRLERKGVLTPIRLNPRQTTGQVYYRGDELLRLVNGEASDREV